MKRVLLIAAALFGALITLAAVATVAMGGEAATRASIDGQMGALELLTISAGLVAATGVVVGWILWVRRRPGLSALAFASTLLIPFVISANQCDVERVCRAVRPLMLPAQLQSWQWRWGVQPKPISNSPQRRLTHQLILFPRGALLPESFAAQARSGSVGGRSSCFSWNDRCEAYVLDFYGDGKRQVGIADPNASKDSYLVMEIFSQGPNGYWSETSELSVTCASSIAALRRGDVKMAMPAQRDISLDGRRFTFLMDPPYGCPELGGKNPSLN